MNELFKKYEKIWKKAIKKHKKRFNKMIEDIAEDTRLTETIIYCKIRDQFIANKIFNNYGYKKVADLGLEDSLDSELKPCEGGDAQCHMDCYMRGKCEYE